jgi:hypothetical protein
MMNSAAKTGYLKALVDAIRDNYGCASLHKASEVVQVRFEQRWVTVQVETFQLINCEDGTMCFAWIHPPHKGDPNVTFAGILAGSGINSPKEAVLAYIEDQDESEAA